MPSSPADTHSCFRHPYLEAGSTLQRPKVVCFLDSQLQLCSFAKVIIMGADTALGKQRGPWKLGSIIVSLLCIKRLQYHVDRVLMSKCYE